MKLKKLVRSTGWKRALNAARITAHKGEIDVGPSDSWKAKMILAEHSPIRLVEFDWLWSQIKMWVTTHLVRHHEGCEKFVASQREDRFSYGVPRDELPQGKENDMMMTANVQALVNISRKRLCSRASKETREAWEAVVDAIREVDPVVADKLVPECIYRGFCPEFDNCCGYCNTEAYKKRLEEYRKTDYPDIRDCEHCQSGYGACSYRYVPGDEPENCKHFKRK